MKSIIKRVFIGFLLLAVSNSLYSQVHAIPLVGMNLSEFAFNSDSFDNRVEVGFQAGVLGRFGKNAFLQTGVLYSQMSNSVSYTDSLGSIPSEQLKVDGILIPIQLGFSIFSADIMRIRLLAGVQLSIPTNLSENSFGLTKSDLKGSNIGAAIGFGFDIFRFVLDANFSFGINDMLTTENFNAHLNLYTLSIGYLIGNSY